MNSTKKKISLANFRTMKWLIFQPELLLIVLVLIFLSGCLDDENEIVPFSNKIPENHTHQHVPAGSNHVIMENQEYNK